MEVGAAIVGKLVSDAIIIAETYLLLRLIFHSPSDVTAETEP